MAHTVVAMTNGVSSDLATARRAQLKAKALTCFAAGLTAIATAAEVGVSRETLYNWRAADDDFARAWEDCFVRRVDHLEDIAFKRAAEASDQLLMFLLRGGRTERYGDKRQIDLTQRSTLDVRVLRALPVDDLLARLEALREAQRGLEIAGTVVDLDEHRELSQATDNTS